MHVVHIHQHRLDREHNILLLLIPGLIFIVVIGVFLILRLEKGQAMFVQTSEIDVSP